MKMTGPNGSTDGSPADLAVTKNGLEEARNGVPATTASAMQKQSVVEDGQISEVSDSESDNEALGQVNLSTAERKKQQNVAFSALLAIPLINITRATWAILTRIFQAGETS